MLALIKDGAKLSVTSIEAPACRAANDVRIRVDLAGICRTDVHVATGRIPSRNPVILGHEMVGTVLETGPDAQLDVGTKVTLFPFVGCGKCNPSCKDTPMRCAAPKQLGVWEHGVFAEQIVVPRPLVWAIPGQVQASRALPPERAAYIEPIAAAHAVAQADIQVRHSGVIVGDGRISQLIQMVLNAEGFERVVAESKPESGAYDFAVETHNCDLDTLIDAVRVGGTIVLRSRGRRPSQVKFQSIVRKQLRLQGVWYGNFSRSIELAAELPLDRLFGETYSLTEWARAFDSCQDTTKPFFRPHD